MGRGRRAKRTARRWSGRVAFGTMSTTMDATHDSRDTRGPRGVVDARDVPALSRSILSLVDDLERCDRRGGATRIRARAVETYGAGWNDAARHRLERLEQQGRRALVASRR